jgi:20S proteasome alpha/beta subunit
MNSLLHWQPKGVEHYGYHNTSLDGISSVDPYARIGTCDNSIKGRIESTMSIVVGLKSQDGIVLATDSRVTSQSPEGTGRIHHDNVKKLWKVGDNMAVAAIGNIGGYQDRIISLMQNAIQHDKAEQASFSYLSDKFGECVMGDWIKWTSHIELSVLMSPLYWFCFILAGYDQSAKPTMSLINWNGSQQICAPRLIQMPYYIAAVDYTIAEYWMKEIETYLPTAKDKMLIRIAAFLISESSILHDEIGGTIQMMLIKKDSLREVTKSELDTTLEHIDKEGKSNLIQMLIERE